MKLANLYAQVTSQIVAELGARFFGLLSLKSTYGGYKDTVALRNSHDKKFPIGVGFGGRVC